MENAMDTYTVLTLFPVTREKMDAVHDSGMETYPDFWSGYLYDAKTAKDIQEYSCVVIDILSDNWEGVLPEIRKLLVRSRETFELLRAMEIGFTIDVGFTSTACFEERDAIKLGYHGIQFSQRVLEPWCAAPTAIEKAEIQNGVIINIPADFWSLFLPFQGGFCISFYWSGIQKKFEEISLDENQKVLEKRWFRKSFLENRREKGENA